MHIYTHTYKYVYNEALVAEQMNMLEHNAKQPEDTLYEIGEYGYFL